MNVNSFYKQYKAWIVVLIVVLAAVLLSIFGSSNNQSKSTVATKIDKAAQTKCMNAVNDVKFCKFFGTFIGVGDYSAVANSTSNGVVTQIQLAIAANGNGRMTVKEGTATSSNIVVYQGYTYVQDPTDNQWLSYAPGSSNAPSLLDIRKSLAEGDFKNSSGQAEQYIDRGTEVVYGTNCYKYQIVNPAETGQIGYIWFSTGDYLLRKLTSTDSTTDMTMTFTYGTVSVTKPFPVKGSAD